MVVTERWAAPRQRGACRHPPSELVRTHSIEIGIAGLLDGDMKQLLPKLLSAGVRKPAPLASPMLPAGPYAHRQLFHRNAIVTALGMRSIGSGGPCVTTRNTAAYLDHSLSTPVVCLNGLWHPEAPMFAGALTGKLYCHGGCNAGETIEAFVQRSTPSGQVLGWEYVGQYRQSSSGDACFADMRGPSMEKTRRKYADSLSEQQNMWELLLECAEWVGVSLQMSNCKARDAKPLPGSRGPHCTQQIRCSWPRKRRSCARQRSSLSSSSFHCELGHCTMRASIAF